MCGSPEKNLATTLSNIMNTSMKSMHQYTNAREKEKELIRKEKKIKELAGEAKQVREEKAKERKGNIRAASAGNGIDISQGTASHLQHKEERQKREDIRKIDSQLQEALGETSRQRMKIRSGLGKSLFNSVSNSLFKLF